MKHTLVRGLTALAGVIVSVALHAAPTVEMKTTLGTMVIELNAEKAPKTTQNFIAYAKSGFYNDTVFHRVINGFMIQGGGFTADMQQKPTGQPIVNEGRNGLKNQRGTLAMARTNDPNSATAQFFINHKDNPGLDYPSPDGAGYAVFGKVVQGLEVVDKIAQVATGSRAGHRDVPREPVVIQTLKILSEK